MLEVHQKWEDLSMPTNHSWVTITQALERVCGAGRTGGTWARFLCPVHENDGHRHNPSLGVKYDRYQRKTIIRCFAGCSDEAVLARLGLEVRDIFDDPLPSGIGGHTRRRTTAVPIDRPRRDYGAPIGPRHIVAVYTYTDRAERPVGQVIRTAQPHEHGTVKGFWQRQRTRTGWRNGGFAPILYRLPAVLAAIADRTPIYLVEGEKDADRAATAGLTATCNAAGAGKFTPAHASQLDSAATIYVIADKDPAGYRHAQQIRNLLGPRVTELHVLRAATGKDLSDHFDAGHVVSDLEPVPFLNPLPAYSDRFNASGRRAGR